MATTTPSPKQGHLPLSAGREMLKKSCICKDGKRCPNKRVHADDDQGYETRLDDMTTNWNSLSPTEKTDKALEFASYSICRKHLQRNRHRGVQAGLLAEKAATSSTTPSRTARTGRAPCASTASPTSPAICAKSTMPSQVQDVTDDHAIEEGDATIQDETPAADSESDSEDVPSAGTKRPPRKPADRRRRRSSASDAHSPTPTPPRRQRRHSSLTLDSRTVRGDGAPKPATRQEITPTEDSYSTPKANKSGHKNEQQTRFRRTKDPKPKPEITPSLPTARGEEAGGCWAVYSRDLFFYMLGLLTPFVLGGLCFIVVVALKILRGDGA